MSTHSISITFFIDLYLGQIPEDTFGQIFAVCLRLVIKEQSGGGKWIPAKLINCHHHPRTRVVQLPS